jgi:hypothetical protein
MKLTRDRFYKIYKTIVELDSKKYNKHFLLNCSVNKKTLSPTVELIETKAKELFTPEYSAFKVSYESLVKEYQEIPSEEIKEKIEKLIEDNSDVLKNYQEQDKTFGAWVNEEIEIELKQIPFAYVPEEIDKNIFDQLEDLFLVD